MSNNDYPCRSGIITGMNISVLSTVTDIEQIRAPTLAMVQKVVSEKAETKKLRRRIFLPEKALKLARQRRFGKKGETLAGIPRSPFEEEAHHMASE